MNCILRRLRSGLRIRHAILGDGAAIAKVHRDSAAYYVGQAPDLFRMPDDDGLVAFAEPGPDDNSATALFTVAEVGDEIVGHLYARVIAPVDSDRFQSISDLTETRLVIEALAVTADALTQGRRDGPRRGRRDMGTRARGDPRAVRYVARERGLWQERMHYEGRSVRLRKRLTS